MGGDSFDEEQVKMLLTGGQTDVDRALVEIHAHRRSRIMRIISAANPALDHAELQDVYADTLISARAAALAGKYQPQDPDVSVMSFLGTIGRNKALDLGRRSRIRNSHAVLDHLVRLRGTFEQSTAAGVAHSESMHSLIPRVRETIAGLPLRQRQVATVWVDLFGDGPASWIQIVEELRRRHSGVFTVNQSCICWSRAREQIKAALADLEMEVR